MPTKKRRVGFIPRSNVLDLIDVLSFENNLSNSKIINILVEEALFKRGLFDIRSGKVISKDDNFDNKVNLESFNNKSSTDPNKNILFKENIQFNYLKEDSLDKEIYEKFLIFLQFQEQMKKRN